MYVDVDLQNPFDYFKNFLDLVQGTSVVIPIMWWIESQTQVEYATFQFIQQLYMFHKTDKSTREVSMVAKGDWAFTCQSVKE